jgi:hypothetical protein
MRKDPTRLLLDWPGIPTFLNPATVDLGEVFPPIPPQNSAIWQKIPFSGFLLLGIKWQTPKVAPIWLKLSALLPLFI